MALETNSNEPTPQEEFLSDLQDLETRMADTWSELDETRKRLNDDHKKLTEILNRYKNLNHSLSQLHAAYNESDADDNNNIKLINKNDSNNINKRLNLLDHEMEVIHENKQRVGSLWLRLLVGRVSMKVWDEGNKLQLKTEYHKFKYRTNFIFLLFPLIQLIWSKYYSNFSWVINQWHNCWLLYYYITLTTREVILKLNGSRLHIWWIIHHQISASGAFLCVLLMRSAYERYSFLFEMIIWMSLIVGILQIWATKYQLRRHYVRLALGKDMSVDIASSESIINEINTQSSIEFKLLKICCYCVYLIELSVGCTIVFYVYWNDMKNKISFDLFKFEAYLCGICFLTLGIGNTYALYTRPSKYMRRAGSREKIFSNSTFKRRNSITGKKIK
eukprot:110051_1